MILAIISNSRNGIFSVFLHGLSFFILSQIIFSAPRVDGKWNSGCINTVRLLRGIAWSLHSRHVCKNKMTFEDSFYDWIFGFLIYELANVTSPRETSLSNCEAALNVLLDIKKSLRILSGDITARRFREMFWVGTFFDNWIMRKKFTASTWSLFRKVLKKSVSYLVCRAVNPFAPLTFRVPKKSTSFRCLRKKD